MAPPCIHHSLKRHPHSLEELPSVLGQLVVDHLPVELWARPSAELVVDADAVPLAQLQEGRGM